MICAAFSSALLLCLQVACTENLCLYTHVEIIVPHVENALAVVVHLACTFISNSYLCVLSLERGGKLIFEFIL